MRGERGEVVLGVLDALGLGKEVNPDGMGPGSEGHSSEHHPIEELEGAGVLAVAAELLDEGEELLLGGGLLLPKPGLHHFPHRSLPPRQPPEQRIRRWGRPGRPERSRMPRRGRRRRRGRCHGAKAPRRLQSPCDCNLHPHGFPHLILQMATSLRRGGKWSGGVGF